MENRKTPEEFLREIEEEENKKNRGKLKIFFGYAAGVGKTYTMLETAHNLKKQNIDVVVGYIEPHGRKETMALLDGLEVLPYREIQYNNILLREFDLDKALERKPQVILVDELAHTNSNQCRHNKRYRDIEELLASGIDVYTTVNVQHIESLNDIVCSITGIQVKERIPDSVFDNAEQVELVDIEPQDLLNRLKEGKVYKKIQADRAVNNFFTLENLTALREIALRKCADRINYLTENNKIKKGNAPVNEHILVCLSSAPSNGKIIRTGARMAKAFRGSFTALFVETSDFPNMSEENKKRLENNIHLAEQLGAKVETVYGDNISYQIGEFARLSRVSKIVIGRSANSKNKFFPKPSLTDKLTESAPNMDIYIIPDASNQNSNYTNKYNPQNKTIPKKMFTLKDNLKCIGILILATIISSIFYYLGFTEANIITVYIVSVLLIAVTTKHPVYSLISSLVSVLVFNFLYTEPRYSLEAYDSGYPVTFLIMFLAGIFTSSLAIKLKENANLNAKIAYRNKILFESNQLFQKATKRNEIIDAMALQLGKLLSTDIVVYSFDDNKLSEPTLYPLGQNQCDIDYKSPNEKAVVQWVIRNNKRAGATTSTLADAKLLYLAIRVNDNVYGAVGIPIKGEPLDSYEESILISILGECALALENEKNARAKEEAKEILENFLSITKSETKSKTL